MMNKHLGEDTRVKVLTNKRNKYMQFGFGLRLQSAFEMWASLTQTLTLPPPAEPEKHNIWWTHIERNIQN